MADDALTIESLAELSHESVEEIDVALLNLIAANGLPGAKELDFNAILDTLDEWAEKVKVEIWRHIYRHDPRTLGPPTEYSYGNSIARFFCWYLLQVLQEDCGVCYHPDRKFDPDFCEPEDVFIHGMIVEGGQGGTCASMPVVYVAVGRRMGLPLYHVSTRGHLFFRWDDPIGTTINWERQGFNLWIPPDRFNVEGSGEGIGYRSDAHYIQWPELWTEVDFNHGRYLRSQSAAEDMADFLMQRSECYYELGNWEECLKAIYYARKFSPDDPRLEGTHAKRTKEFDEHHERQAEAIREMDAWNRKLRAEAKPAIEGHDLNCKCGHCRKIKNLERSSLNSEHALTCRCKRCSEIRSIQESAAQGFPAHHGASCQCLQCKTARENAQSETGQSGHPPSCPCPGCNQHRRVEPTRPSIPKPNSPNMPSLPGVPNVQKPNVSRQSNQLPGPS